MYRGIFPFILATIGFAMIVLATSMSLFEWQISEFATDFPSTYEIAISPSPWKAKLGNSLENGSYVFGEVIVSRNRERCVKDGFDFIVRRSARDKSLDQIWLNIYTNLSWISGWSWIEVILSSIYILWFMIWSKQAKVLHAIILTVIAIILFLNLTQILRLIAPFPFPHYFGIVVCYPGTITFNAILSKIHYETIMTLLVGILFEVSVPVLMISQIRQVIADRKSPLNDKSSSV